MMPAVNVSFGTGFASAKRKEQLGLTDHAPRRFAPGGGDHELHLRGDQITLHLAT
jgi:hypothetical protein